MRNRLDEQLEILDVELIKMGAMCEEIIEMSLGALFDKDPEMVKEVAKAEEELDRKEKEIENLCLKLLLRQQPVARDLRVISSALKMISDMERIGDQAKDIAEISRFITGSNYTFEKGIRDMGREAAAMVTKSIDSFVKHDLNLAYEVMKDDDEVDELFIQIRKQIIEYITGGTCDGEMCADFLMVAKYLERIADHAVNVAEWVAFSITGRH
ncbi:MAG: phosphate signaling complex protein PhoU [Eubacteriales bacterium]|nr:phosphate signaling complex protein PhoU [Eubacteriales bacterium]MDD4391007.1 phosphate signaling complex protein PhoU [Eubacteriales bacterium]